MGFGRDDEDDADDKSSAQSQAQSQVQSQAQSQAQAQSHVPPPSMAYDTSIYSVPPGAEAAPAMSAISVMSAISAIDVNLHVEDHTHDIPMDAGADSEYTHSLPPPSPAVMTHVYSRFVARRGIVRTTQLLLPCLHLLMRLALFRRPRLPCRLRWLRLPPPPCPHSPQ